jgi:hypothetical protein
VAALEEALREHDHAREVRDDEPPPYIH